jgi:hypothetical protein
VGGIDTKKRIGIIRVMEEYTEDVLEAVKSNFDYLNGISAVEVATFLDNLADSMYDGELLSQVAAALRDVEEGVA